MGRRKFQNSRILGWGGGAPYPGTFFFDFFSRSTFQIFAQKTIQNILHLCFFRLFFSLVEGWMITGQPSSHLLEKREDVSKQ